MDQHRGLADDLIYGRDLDHRPDETPLSERPEFAGAAGVSHRRGEFSYDSAPAWSTSNALAHPREVAMRDPLNPASRPYAGVRTSLTFRSASAEMPAHMHAFVARDFSELKQVEEMRQRSVELNHEETLKEQNQVELFEAAIQLKARTLRTRFDYLNAGNDGLVNETGDFNDFTHAGKDTLSAIRI
ncbi:hypothetical protein KFE25_010555 [Diacronema lutheri]|uniref:Uncharacterized protein n=1 Tax=Diacronema lutheri TaxID=2081491 RepID=A0A8J5XCW2_DIALT|nr:hypothetical protein KFE25_010555 [Diacronema lutheri]